MQKRAYNFPRGGDIAADLRDRYGYEGDLVPLFADHHGRLIDKWHHYLPLYDRYLGPWRGKPVRFLEIGVFKGGSLQMWRQFFGPEAIIFGIDINPDCAAFNDETAQVRIGDQADPAFLEAVVAEMGGLDIVLDDGSHHMEHVPKALEVLFPHVSRGGLYMIEDLHTAYWPRYGGGYRARGNFFRYVLEMIHDMHSWYHQKGAAHPATAPFVTGIHVHDSIVVLERSEVQRPAASRVK